MTAKVLDCVDFELLLVRRVIVIRPTTTPYWSHTGREVIHKRTGNGIVRTFGVKAELALGTFVQ